MPSAPLEECRLVRSTLPVSLGSTIRLSAGFLQTAETVMATHQPGKPCCEVLNHLMGQYLRKCRQQPVAVEFKGRECHTFTSCLTSTIFAGWRQLLLPVHLLILSSLLGRSGPVAGDVEFQDDRVVDHTVDGRSGGHGVGEDVLPLGEDQVGRDA